jgi:hypothetical protein
MLREINTKSIVIAVSIVAVTAWTTFAGTRLLVTYSLDRRLTALELELEVLKNQTAAQVRQTQFLYDLLADVTFDATTAMTPPVPAKAKVEAWQQNRNEEFRRRLLALEQWRLREQGRGR